MQHLQRTKGHQMNT